MYPGSNGYRGYFQRIDEAYLIPLSGKKSNLKQFF